MKKVKKLIIIVLISIFIILGILFHIQNNRNKPAESDSKSANQNEDTSVSKEESNSKEPISEKNFYKVIYCVEKYANKDYIFIPLNIKVNSGISVDKYLVYGYFADKNYNIIENMYLYVNLDNMNKTFSIQKIKDNDIDFDTIEIENDEKDIEKKENNSFENLFIDESYIVKKCFNNLKMNLILRSEYVYENLYEEYKKAKFSDINTFNEYIKDNTEKYKKMDILKYTREEKDGNIRYTFINNYYDSYVLTIGINDFKQSIMLDNYTIPTEDMIKQYNKAVINKKIYTNTENFINMINNKDYESAYKILNSEYREENFSTLDEFKKYIQENFYEYNILRTKPNIVEGDEGEYMWTIIIRDSVALAANEKEITIVMILGEDMNYTIAIKD